MATNFEFITDKTYIPKVGDLLTHFADGDIGVIVEHVEDEGIYYVQFFGPEDNDETYAYTEHHIKEYMQHFATER